ncbi:hypothetical protein JG687_00010005 [Phytophthora cactorum]|uniref:AB hydrolase-1 domain-containing protein n=1 Tax=Phytophthora cactorum TaxID=29920 RepID=A0A8T1UB66_9STRA|nr:hypothetical protein JG687_00010005 [Phytophthora cactorum]
MEDPTDEDFCRVDTNSENETRSELSSVDATGEDDEDAADSTPTPENLSAEEQKERLKWMAELLVSADAMRISSREVIGLRSMKREFREELGSKQGRMQQKSMTDFIGHKSKSTRALLKMSGATLLFAHGGGFCKQIWDPIIRRLKISPIVHQLATEFVTFDFPYHGTKRDESVAPKLHESNPTSLRVYHPAQDVLPSTTAEVQRQVQLLRENYDAKGERPALIGIGHSMGAGALWNAEVQDPGTFDGLILFEPVYGEDDPVVTDKVTSFLVGVTLQRKALWSSRQEAVQYFETLKNFKSWDRESLAAYLQGALIEDEAAGKTVLACHPHIEASLYCHKYLRFMDHELKRPKCSVRFHRGERSNMFFTPHFEHAVKLCPEIYSIGEPMKNCAHLMVLEDPESTTNEIVNDLVKTAPFRKDTPK